MKEVRLKQGQLAIVDDEDFEFLSQWKCRYHNAGYAVTTIKGRSILMHRIIMSTPLGMSTDHKDGNGLNNRKSNLRVCTHGDNMHNQRKARHNSSGFKGVTYRKASRQWQAYIKINRSVIFLGHYREPVEAALTYNDSAIKYHGEFAKLNEALFSYG